MSVPGATRVLSIENPNRFLLRNRATTFEVPRRNDAVPPKFSQHTSEPLPCPLVLTPAQNISSHRRIGKFPNIPQQSDGSIAFVHTAQRHRVMPVTRDVAKNELLFFP